jgi:hypothetical protein
LGDRNEDRKQEKSQKKMEGKFAGLSQKLGGTRSKKIPITKETSHASPRAEEGQGSEKNKKNKKPKNKKPKTKKALPSTSELLSPHFVFKNVTRPSKGAVAICSRLRAISVASVMTLETVTVTSVWYCH